MAAASTPDPLLARALEVAADLKARLDDRGELPEGIDLFFQDVRTLDERRKGKEGNKLDDVDDEALALTKANLLSLKRQRMAREQAAADASDDEPLHPVPTPEVVILRLIELPKLVLVQIIHLLEFHELASLDTTCSTFHPFAPIGLVQLSAEMRAQWMLKPWQVKAKAMAPPEQAWSQWLVDVQWRERVERVNGNRFLACSGDRAGQHALVVSKKGVVMSCGYDIQEGCEIPCPELGHGKGSKSQESLKVIEAMKGKKVVQVSAGYSHNLILTQDGTVYSCGFGVYGQLGHGDEDNHAVPVPIESLRLRGEKVVQISAGNDFNLVLTDSGDVYSFGYGGSGQLGHGDMRESQQNAPKLVATLKGKRVVQVSAGSYHGMVLTQSGDVYSFGSSDNGKLGHEDNAESRVPKMIEALTGKHAASIHAGHWQSILRARAGGGGLTQALKGTKVLQVSAGAHHSLVLTERGDVFSFGAGDKGMLGHGDTQRQYLPTQIEAMKGKKVTRITAGKFHSLLLTDSGDVYSFGHGRQGQLGHGDQEQQRVPKLIEALQGQPVVEVVAGQWQSMVRTKDGEVYAFGLTFAKVNPEDENMPIKTRRLTPYRIFPLEVIKKK